MKKLGMILTLPLLSLLLLTGCDPDTPGVVQLDPPELQGQAYFSDYVAIGNSLTAGYMDAGLIGDGQQDSYPAQIARQIGIPAGAFVQPTVLSPGIGSTDTGDPSVIAGVLHFDGSSITLLGTTPAAQIMGLLPLVEWPVAYQNLGVPGATALDATEALDSSTSQSPGNKFFDFILRTSGMGPYNMVEQAVGQGPSLVTVWIGNNDILGGATGGQPELGVNITPPAAFAALFEGMLVDLLDGVAARNGNSPLVLIANIPDISTIPYFIPRALFEALAAGAGVDEVQYAEADCQAVLLPALSLSPILVVDQVVLEIPADHGLTGAETAVVSGAVQGYNDAIASLAMQYGAHVVDINQTMQDIQDGLYPGIGNDLFLVDQATAISLDGIHPNNVGYGIVANAFIAKINTVLGSELAEPVPQVDLASLSWDPTYGHVTMKGGDAIRLTPAAARAAGAIFRR